MGKSYGKKQMLVRLGAQEICLLRIRKMRDYKDILVAKYEKFCK